MMTDQTDSSLPRANRPNYYRNADVTQLGQPANSQDMIGYLFIVKPSVLFGQYYVVRRNALIGIKESCHVQLDDELVADPHARIKLEPSSVGLTFIMYDFGSENGTWVNGHRVSGQTSLVENDVIQIGATTFVFKVLT